MGIEVDIKEAAKGLVIAAGLAANVAHGNIQKAADTISKGYSNVSTKEIERDIADQIRKNGAAWSSGSK